MVDTPLDAAWWTDHAWGLGLTLLIAIVVTIAGRRWSGRLRKRANAAGDDGMGRRLRRTATVVGIVATTALVVAWFVFLLVLMDAFGVSIAPLIASAGIIGVALGFGAQTLVKDTISGMFIFLEAQYDVGDIVDLTTDTDTVSGTIERLNLRTTSLRQYDGSLSIIPNGTIQITNNRTRGWGRAVVDIRLALSEDADDVRRVIETLFDEVVDQPPLVDWLRDRPEVLGITQMTDVAQVLRIAAETSPSHRVDTERLLREKIVARIADEGIKVPPVTAASATPATP
ncbi:MAG TPA: mechanosensitive ion channel family protein [Actinomycetota bacterium]|nr:mechanosensitive ion channel family protein [Actinomycetota bacterium]